MTYDYGQATAILGPLATIADPAGYDLCKDHAERLSVPRGWEIIRLADAFTPPPPNDAELMALANAVRAASESDTPRQSLPPGSHTGPVDREAPTTHLASSLSLPGVRRRHLTLVDEPKTT